MRSLRQIPDPCFYGGLHILLGSRFSSCHAETATCHGFVDILYLSSHLWRQLSQTHYTMKKTAMTTKRELKVAGEERESNKEKEPMQREDYDPLEPALAQGREDPCWGPTTKKHVYDVPLADHWQAMVGTDIKDGSSEMVFRILGEERIGRLKTGDPIFRVTVGATDNRVLAVIQREMKNLSDRYVIYGLTANGHEPIPYNDMDSGQKRFDMYPVVEIVQSVLGKNYTIKSPGNDGEILFKATNGNIRAALICCGPCLLVGVIPFKFAFHKRGQDPKEVALYRDQSAQVLEVTAGTSPLLGICMAYAVDRLTRPVL
jgi:hypothetical protein